MAVTIIHQAISKHFTKAGKYFFYSKTGSMKFGDWLYKASRIAVAQKHKNQAQRSCLRLKETCVFTALGALAKVSKA